MIRVLTYKEIDRGEWSRLVQTSATGTWFQTPEAFEFFESMPELFAPYAIGVVSKPKSDLGLNNEETLCGVCVGYVTMERNPIKQYFTRRAIIIGGPAFADDATDEEVETLLEAVKTKTRHLQSLNSDLHETTHQSACMQAFRQPEDLSHIAVEQQDASQKHAALTKNTKNIFYCYEPIYIETRNFNSYEKWKEAFEKAGFEYKKHLNFHVDCTDKEKMWERLSENRKRQIKKQPIPNIVLRPSTGRSIEQSSSPIKGGFMDVSEQDVREWYEILSELYRTKVKTPLWPVEFFVEAYRQGIGQFMLVRHEGKIIGGSMVVRWKPNPSPSIKGRDVRGTVYEWFECGLNAQYKEQYPSVMATYAGMCYAAEEGIGRYDMMGAGVPDVPYGVRDFKAEFGGQLVEHGRFLHVVKPTLYALGKAAIKVIKG